MWLDKIPFIKQYREKKRLQTARLYLGELGKSVFVTALWLGVLLAAAEMFFPGFAANYLSPGACLTVLAVSGGLALLSPEHAGKTKAGRIAYAATGAAASVCAFLAVWYYFSSVPDAQKWLSLTVGLTVAAMFALFDQPDL